MNNIIKIGLSILLLSCLLDMSYGYFQLVRFIVLVGFGYLAYTSYLNQRQTEMFVFGILALLFQPFAKISLGRELWNIIDVIVAIALIVNIFKSRKVEN